jgi:hypothetical protein
MARKKAQTKKQETTLVPHRTLQLSALRERAKTGDSAQAVRAYLQAGGSAEVFGRSKAERMLPLLRYVILNNTHPHREPEESVRLLVEAGTNTNSVTGPEGEANSTNDCKPE